MPYPLPGCQAWARGSAPCGALALEKQASPALCRRPGIRQLCPVTFFQKSHPGTAPPGPSGLARF